MNGCDMGAGGGNTTEAESHGRARWREFSSVSVATWQRSSSAGAATWQQEAST